MAELKEILKKLRSEKNMSQVALAESLGVAPSTVAMWEVGKRFPTRECYEALADLFNVDIDYLYCRSDVRQRYHFDGDGNMMVHLNQLELKIIQAYRAADSLDRELILRILKLEEKGASADALA